MSFFIASGSLFFGQMQLFPKWFNESLWPLLFGFFPVILLFIYSIKFLIAKYIKGMGVRAEQKEGV